MFIAQLSSVRIGHKKMEGLVAQALHRNREKNCQFETGFLLEAEFQSQLNLATGGAGPSHGSETRIWPAVHVAV